MQIIVRYLLLISMVSAILVAGNIRFLPYKKNEFSPILSEKIAIGFNLSVESVVNVEIYTPDGALIRTLTTGTAMKKGNHILEWDGKDKKGTVVPDEAYNVVLKAITIGKVEIVDPRKTSGGIVQKNLNPKIGVDGKIRYTLPTPSRVLIRLGIGSGAMLRSVITWKPKNSGKNLQYWDGYDQDHLVKIQKHKDFKIIFSAFSLADYAIITTGNRESYFDYVEKNAYKPDLSSKKARLFNAKSKLMSPYYVRTLTDTREPIIRFVFPDNIKRDKEGIPIVKKGDRVRVKVIMDEKDAQRMAQVKYEITFFDDLDFTSEEEMGYVPISWLWSPQKEKGKHILTVNIASFKGHIGLKSTSYIID
ncbi:FlgD immunoglobulin-like domain containing protein [Sulfurovum sp.]|uniref:FlgD immunoglobulin-like domain containing protein n=1 Tax=Sulfurovum sp. TaxID=1969726 RepID=UPI0025F6B93E|nr:FlgD immunoglobulin-like domain containing protein [Sulfurovum sp.]